MSPRDYAGVQPLFYSHHLNALFGEFCNAGLSQTLTGALCSYALATGVERTLHNSNRQRAMARMDRSHTPTVGFTVSPAAVFSS